MADIEKQELPGTDNMLNLDFDQQWQITKEINENIRHYNEHQTRYRTLASQWLIAAMAGIGFLFSTTIGLPISNLILIFLISVISALGILQLWRMDIVLFQRIIESFFGVGVTMEENNPSLPQIKRRILDRVPLRNAGQNLFYFYFFIIGLFLLLALLSFIYLGKPDNDFYFLYHGWVKVVAVVIYIVALVFIYKYMWRMSDAGLDKSNKKVNESKTN